MDKPKYNANGELLTQCWATPWDLYKLLDEEFHFQIDVCASKHNTKCKKFITIEQDSLNPDVRWITKDTTSAFCNPGFANLLPWMKKASEEVRLAPHAIIVVVGLISPSTQWWNNYAKKSCDNIRLMCPRVQFVPPPELPHEKERNDRESAIFIFKNKSTTEDARIWTWCWKGARSRTAMRPVQSGYRD